MKVYIEYVFLDNLIFNYLILFLALKSEKISIIKWRIFLSSLFGTVIAIIFPFFKIHKIFLFLLKIALGTSMVLIAGKYINFKKFFITFNVFLLYTFLFGGFIFGIMSVLGIDYSFLYGTANGILPLGIIVLMGVIIFRFLMLAYTRLFEKKMIYPFVRNCTLVANGQKITVSALIDSGNLLLYDGDNPVCVVGSKLAKKMYLSGFLNNRSVGNMSLSTISGQGILKIYQIDEMQIYYGGKVHIINKPKIGINSEKNDLSEEYQLILSAAYAVEN